MKVHHTVYAAIFSYIHISQVFNLYDTLYISKKPPKSPQLMNMKMSETILS